MNDAPTIAPLLLASLLEDAPSRVRKRLDKAPNAAESWSWSTDDQETLIAAGEETVTLSPHDGTLNHRDQLRCSCLLSPRCFHILACASLLTLSQSAPIEDSEVDPEEVAEDASKDDRRDQSLENAVTPEMRSAARSVRDALSSLLLVGARASGALVQSALLRGGYQCRAHALVSLGNTTIRIAEGIRRIRAQENTANARDLRDDTLEALDTVEWLSQKDDVPNSMIGTSRRQFDPVELAKIDGWVAEPILTRSGYGGLVVHFMSPQGVYQVVETRPGDAELVRQAYRGGIDLGTFIRSGHELARNRILVHNASASHDGRLGRGESTRWMIGGESQSNDLESRVLGASLPDQVRNVFSAAEGNAKTNQQGSDILSFDAEIQGAAGASLRVSVDDCDLPVELHIAIDHPDVAFRENLELLARCPGLKIGCLGRLRLESAGGVDLLAIRSPKNEPEDARRLRFPDTWKGRCFVGLDRLLPKHIQGIERYGREVTLDQQTGVVANDGLLELDRRLDAVILGGYRAVAGPGSSSLRRDRRTLRGRGQSTAEALIQRLAIAGASMSSRGRTEEILKVVLACALYLQGARMEYHRQCWMGLFR